MKLPRLLALALCSSLPAQALVVNTIIDEDDGNGMPSSGSGISLREAVKYAFSEPVTFHPSLSGALFRLTSGPLVISSSVIINASTLPERIKISGDATGNGGAPGVGDTHVFEISTGNPIFRFIEITGGYKPNGGAAIHSTTSGRITLENSRISGNLGTSAVRSPGQLFIKNCEFSGNVGSAGAAIGGSARMMIENSAFSGNHSTGHGGAIHLPASNHPPITGTSFTGNSSVGEGGAIYSLGELDLENCTMTGNSASNGGGICSQENISAIGCTFTSNSSVTEGGAIRLDWGSSLTLTGCTFSGNSSEWGGGAYVSTNLTADGCTFDGNSAYFGGAVQVTGIAEITRSTFTGNRGEYGGALSGMPKLNMALCTVTGNSAVSAGGIHIYDHGLVSLNSSIVTGNSAQTFPDMTPAVAAHTGTNNLLSGNPQLAPLGNYGGPTHTMPPLPGSPAINGGAAIDPEALLDLSNDQRGFARVGQPDIGAAEYQGRADSVRVWNVDPDGDGVPYGIEQATGTDSFAWNSSPLSGPMMLEEGGGSVLSFPISAAVEPGTRWVVSRSIDLTDGSFLPVYQFDGASDLAAEGITFNRGAGDITVTDTNPPAGNAFYRLEAVLEPLPEP